MPRILDVGCGQQKFPGSIGIDMNQDTAADVLCHLDRGALPFRDNAFDEVRATHLIEHVDNVIRTVEEFHRVTRPGGRVVIITPHYTDFSSFCDPTHKWHLNSFSFRYFYPGGIHGSDHWYTRARLREKRVEVRLLQFWRYLGFEFLVNHSVRFRRFWEFYLCYIVRGKVMTFELEVLK